MKVLHVYKDFDPPVRGGIERHIALMCRYQRQWADVEALTCSRSLRTRRVDREGTQVTEVGEWGRFQSAPASPLFPYYLKKAEADVIVIHVPNPTAEVAYLLARPRGTMVVRYHSDVVRQALAMRVYRPILMKFLAKAAMILPTSKQYMNTSLQLQANKERCRVVPLGIVKEDFDAPDAEQIAKLQAAYGGPFVLFVGRHRYYKGLDFLVRAARMIDAPLVVCGDGPERGAAETLARGLGVQVVFTGQVSDKALVAHLHACSVFAFPSIERSEAFGMSILEAHACGKPVVATQLGTGVEYANLHEQTGLNVPPRQPEALAEAINALLSDEPRRRRYGEFAKRRVEREFQAEAVAKQELALYREALSWNDTGT